MTDEELIARLRDWEEHDEGKINDAREASADRIAELEKEIEVLHKEVRLLEIGFDASQAKLTKAVEALRETTKMLSQCTFTNGQYFERRKVVDKANATLAELEGK